MMSGRTVVNISSRKMGVMIHHIYEYIYNYTSICDLLIHIYTSFMYYPCVAKDCIEVLYKDAFVQNH